MAMKTPFIISTTALNRPILHEDVFPDWISWIIQGLDTNVYDVHWFVNIDMIDKLPYTYTETVAQFEKMCPSVIKMHIYRCDGPRGNFLKACQRLSVAIDTHINSGEYIADAIDRSKIMWLEDDWKLHPNVIVSLSDVLSLYSTTMSNVNLTNIRPNHIHALAPSIVSYQLWKRLHYAAWENQGGVQIDPEHCVGLYYRRVYGKPMYIHNLTVINKPVGDKFFDQQHMCGPNSFYTFHNDMFKTDIQKDGDLSADKFIHRHDVISRYADANTMLFVRISPTACGDGCHYGRIFLEKNGIYKNKSRTGCDDFYTICD